jgi:hypothetical protein
MWKKEQREGDGASDLHFAKGRTISREKAYSYACLFARWSRLVEQKQSRKECVLEEKIRDSGGLALPVARVRAERPGRAVSPGHRRRAAGESRGGSAAHLHLLGSSTTVNDASVLSSMTRDASKRHLLSALCTMHTLCFPRSTRCPHHARMPTSSAHRDSVASVN